MLYPFQCRSEAQAQGMLKAIELHSERIPRS